MSAKCWKRQKSLFATGPSRRSIFGTRKWTSRKQQ